MRCVLAVIYLAVMLMAAVTPPPHPYFSEGQPSFERTPQMLTESQTSRHSDATINYATERAVAAATTRDSRLQEQRNKPVRRARIPNRPQAFGRQLLR
ncbi:MAG: hypothetical protein ACK5Q5_15400 [Planctomycetaceae bacterium]